LYRHFRVFVVLAIVLPSLTGCLLRTHKVERKVSGAPVLNATLDELVSRINTDAAKIKSLNATVDIATSAGGEKKGKVSEYQEIRGYVLVRKPSMLRMIGLFPVVRNRMFDMVSDGDRFRLSIPPKNRFIVGSNDIEQPSKEPLENLRPNHILDALLLREIDPQNEIAVIETGQEYVTDTATKNMVEQPMYIVSVVHRDENNHWSLSRKIFFSRFDLQPLKQVLYDKAGEVATIATYDNFTPNEGLNFPNIIQIERPQEEYTIQLGVVKLRLNEPLKDEQFQLAQPAGSELKTLDPQSKVGSPAAMQRSSKIQTP
jgi:outer membrane lipoprotein-sorting protein